MWECACGFANDDGAMRCVACDARPPVAEATRGSLTFVNLRTHERIVVTRPGGLVGRAGDFKPGSFSPRVSRVHLVAEAHDNGPWTIEFVGRHKTEIDASGTWVAMEPDQPREVVGGEKLRMADMIFRLEVASFDHALNRTDVDSQSEIEEESDIGPVQIGWVVRCPVCGAAYHVENEQARIASCASCFDPMDAGKIARCAPQPEYE